MKRTATNSALKKGDRHLAAEISRKETTVLLGASPRFQRAANRRRRNRQGAILTMELLLVLPIVVGLLFAIVEFGLLWQANSQIKLASEAGCRVASLPGSDAEAVQAAIDAALVHSKLIAARRVAIDGGQWSGEPVSVEIRLAMREAAPDLLAFLGFGLGEQELIARTVLRKE